MLLYAMIVTGLWICALIGGGKERQDRIMEQKERSMECRHFIDQAKKLEEENGKLREEMETLHRCKHILAEQYIKIQNEYAYYRILVRTADPKTNESACENMNNYKRSLKNKGGS
jgi:hypothetical protein